MDGSHDALMALPPNERWLYSHAEGVENDNDLVVRFLGTVTSIAKQNMGKTVLIAAHGGCIRVSLIKLGFGTHADVPPRSFKNAGYIELSYDGETLKLEKAAGIDAQIVADSKKRLQGLR
jgi:broad specificity phosphatase PhoE